MLVGASSAVGNRQPSLFETVLWSPALCVSVRTHVHACVCVWGPVTLPVRLLCPWNFAHKHTGMGYGFLPQAIFLTTDPGIKSASFVSLTLAGGFLTIAPPGKPNGELLLHKEGCICFLCHDLWAGELAAKFILWTNYLRLILKFEPFCWGSDGNWNSHIPRPGKMRIASSENWFSR